jgi:hypothetical protein
MGTARATPRSRSATAELRPPTTESPIACSDRMNVYANKDGDSRTQVAKPLLSIAVRTSRIRKHSLAQAQCFTMPG